MFFVRFFRKKVSYMIRHLTHIYSFAVGNQEIINILKENGHSFEEYLKTSVKYHRYELTTWLLENYKCQPVPLHKCIQYYNFDAFLYFLEHGHSLKKIDRFNRTYLHNASMIGNLSIVKYLIEKGANIEAKDEFGHMIIFQLLNVILKKNVGIETKYKHIHLLYHKKVFYKFVCKDV